MPDKNILKLFKESLKNKNTYIPNLLTASRLLGAFIIPGLFLTGNIPGAVIAVAVFASTDFFDGKIARKYNGFSEFGRILDPVADKVFAIVPSLAILPSSPILAVNIISEAIIAYINTKSYTGNGHPKSSFLGKFKTFCLFPAVSLCYLNAALNLPITNILATTFCIGTFGVQGLTVRDYYKKAQAEAKTSVSNNEEALETKEEDEKTAEKDLSYQDAKTYMTDVSFQDENDYEDIIQITYDKPKTLKKVRRYYNKKN